MSSIERTLLTWILGALSLGALLVALLTYVVTLDEMHEVFDADLKNIAQAVASYHHAGYGPGDDSVVVLPNRTDTPEDSEIVTLTWTREGKRVFASDPRVELPFSSTHGLSRTSANGEDWIVYSSVNDDGVAQAAQRVSARQEMAGESASKVLPPLLGLVVVVGGLLIFGLRKGLKPLQGAAQDVSQRSAHSLDPISLDGVPNEIQPLVVSINDLMTRLGEAFATQRRFLADAAHELRTPITALRLQLQLLQGSGNDAERSQAMTEFANGVDRSQRLVEQLLNIARADANSDHFSPQPLNLTKLVQSVVARFSLKADVLDIDLGVSSEPTSTGVWVNGDSEQLTVLLNNLVENALRFTPAGGVVDVKISQDHDALPVLRVIDNGPGISDAERERVFDRFYRGSEATALARDGYGSGLGLAIVQAIAARHGAHVGLASPADHRGLEVTVRFRLNDQAAE
ncbi:ATP-binding protein [Hydrogenophaga sp.]|uniref:ATP-binding protein n=1 Tax=Hydrogenophaga sp. TaxID=1904254 RepID=UPI003AF6CE4F